MGAPKGNRNAVGNRGGTGRPPIYNPAYHPNAAKNLCLLFRDVTDAKLASFFDVSEETINDWKRKYVEFTCALKEGKEVADNNVARSLYERATGYTHEAVKIFADPKTGKKLVVPYTEHYPPDTAAAFIWLKNRQPEVWRDKKQVEI